MEHFDLLVIGSGPGGYIAAVRGAQLGMKTAIVEKQHLGGICLNWGCIPTKALLKSAEVYHTAKHADEFGIICKDVKFDFAKIIKRSRDIAAHLSKGVAGLIKKHQISLIDGHARLLGDKKISIEHNAKKTEISATHIIIATGAGPREIPNLKIDGKFIWSYKEAMIPKELPKSILVVGSGAIGVEFASFYNMLGADVTVAEILPRILAQEDEEIALTARKSFEKRGIKILTGTELTESKVSGGSVNVKLRDKSGMTSEHNFEKIISAVGVVPNTFDIGLGNTKVKLEFGCIKIDEYLKTDEPGVYAIGDVTSAPWLAHKASHEGIVCVEKIAGLSGVHPIKKDCIPACTYSTPQIASIGLTEAKAKEKGFEINIGRFPFFANGKAIASGDTEGMVKTIFDKKTGELLGAHMIGTEVTEMIQGFAIGKTLETTEIELMNTIFPHPTISESIHESVLDAFGKALNI
jgi:dihydrolipoamide dehydrogenase